MRKIRVSAYGSEVLVRKDRRRSRPSLTKGIYSSIRGFRLSVKKRRRRALEKRLERRELLRKAELEAFRIEEGNS